MEGIYDHISQMEPLLPKRETLEKRSVELIARSNELSGKLHPITGRAIAKHLEVMNSYYSNLIEGNRTKPLDIEKALKGDYKSEPKKRALAEESRAHVEVHREFEKRVRLDPDLDICSEEFLRDIHRSFYEKLPDELRFVRNKSGKIVEVIPGELRTGEVEVGEHIAPLASTLPRFLERFRDVYEPSKLSSIDKVMVAAASHHRLAWIHPFTDGNGRVARLFTHMYLIRADIDGNGLWTLSRGLARNQDAYYAALANADAARLNNYDGRGNLSLEGLHRFCTFILDVAIDQVTFMSELLAIEKIPKHLRDYTRILTAKEEVHESAEHVLREIYFLGEVPRSEIKRITGLPERSARRVTDALVAKELIYSDTKLGPWKLNITTEASHYIFPNLFS